MFPNNMIHLGGDEVSFGNEKWGTDKNIATFIRKHKIDGLKGLENYFMRRMADSVFKMNAKVLAWDELAESSLPRDKTIVFWWRHDKPEQLNKALEAIQTPAPVDEIHRLQSIIPLNYYELHR